MVRPLSLLVLPFALVVSDGAAQERSLRFDVAVAVTPAGPPYTGQAPADRGWATAGTFAGAAIGSWLLSLPTSMVLYHNANDLEVIGDAGYSPTANAGMLISGALGAGLGGYAAGRLLGEDRSLSGSLIGASLASAPFFLGLEYPYLPYFAFTLGTAAQAVGALIGGR